MQCHIAQSTLMLVLVLMLMGRKMLKKALRARVHEARLLDFQNQNFPSFRAVASALFWEMCIFIILMICATDFFRNFGSKIACTKIARRTQIFEVALPP